MNTKKEWFEKLYYATPDADIAKRFNVSVGTVRNYAKKLGFKGKGKGYVYPNDRRFTAQQKVTFI